MTDLATGLYTYGAIMAGLLQRYKTGKGLHIDCNLLSTQVGVVKKLFLFCRCLNLRIPFAYKSMYIS